MAFVLATDSYAQQTKKPAATPPAQQPAQQAAPPGAVMPDAFKLNMMIRSSMIALNQANKTGNYTVLQDLGAPSFRASNDSARLAQIFSHLRSRNLDLSPVLFFTPKLVRQPQFNQNNILRLVGYFETTPERVNFDLYFQLINGDWRIFGIGVNVAPVDKTAALPSQPANSPPAGRAAQAPPPKTATAADDAQATAARAERPKEMPSPARRQTPPPAAEAAVENRTTSNAVRIDLSQPAEATPEPPEGATAADGKPSAPSGGSGGSDFWSNLFSGN